MRYRPRKLIKSYAKDLAAKAGLHLRLAQKCAAAQLLRLRIWLAWRWDESLFKRYLVCQAEDFARSLHFMRRSRYLPAGLAICAVMCLGFYVISPHEQKASYQVRVDMNRPLITALSDQDRIKLAAPTAYELAALYTSKTGNDSGWFHAGSLDQEAQDSAPKAAPKSPGKPKIAGWQSKSSSLGISNGKVVAQNSLGQKTINKLSDIQLSTYSTALPQRGLQNFAEGSSNQEFLLAELNLQGATKAFASALNMHSYASAKADRAHARSASYSANSTSADSTAPQQLAAGLTASNTGRQSSDDTGKAASRPAKQLAANADKDSFNDKNLAEYGSDYYAKLSPRWQHRKYGTDIFAAPSLHWSGQELAAAESFICPQNRMEQASWLNMLYASHNKSSIYAVQKAKHYRPYVERFAGHYSLPPSLVYAIMRVESGFNPLAISHANALGLMQVVPTTAGNEVHVFLRGKKASPAPELLFKPESNIEYGTTYLHLLSTRHFKDVKNPISREMCIIAAYNGGPNAVYRTFNRNREKAISEINRLTPEQLYTTLVAKLPSQETRDYLPRVLAARNDFLRGQAMMR